MAVTAVIIIFIVSILGNVLLPSGDIYSDVNLTFKTLTFKLGESTLLQGCKICHDKTEDDVYKVRNQSCQQCLYSVGYACGHYPQLLEKLQE